MALVPCIECKHEISTEAKTCPNCGAKNRAFKSKTGKYWLMAAIFASVIFYAYVYIPLEEYMENTTNCDTRGNRESFIRVIDGSSYSQLKKLRVIDITNIETIKTGESMVDLVCDATIHYNSQHEEKYRFTWEESESGNTLIIAERRK